MQELDLDRDKLPLERAIGIEWNIESDQFTFQVTKINRPANRRGILSTVSSVYDPLGFLDPFILKATQVLQELCNIKCGWDEPIPEVLCKVWRRWLLELDELSRFQAENFGLVKTAWMHHDASQLGYGTVTYLRLADNDGKIHIAFVLGKSRVTPLKQMR